MHDRINVGVIGCGEIAQIMHLPYLAESNAFRVWSLCNTSAEPLQFCAEHYGVPEQRCYSDYDMLLNDPELDAVVICTADHYAPAMKAISFGKHLFVEKPLAFNARQAEEIVSSAKLANVVLQVGYMKLYDPAFTYFADKVKAMSSITHVNVHNMCGDFGYMKNIYSLKKGSSASPTVKAARKQAQDAAVREQLGTDDRYFTGPYMDMLLGTTHDTVLLRKMFGSLKVRYGDIDGNGTVLATLETNKGTRISFEEGYIDQRSVWDETISVWGPDCRIVLEFPSPYLRNAATLIHLNENEPDGTNRESVIRVSYDEAFRREWKAFAESICNGSQPCADGAGAVEDILIAANIVKAAMQNMYKE